MNYLPLRCLLKHKHSTKNLPLKFTELSTQMRSLHIPSSNKFNAKEDYEIKELARLTTEMAELMVTDEKLASGDVEWSEIHQ